MRRLHTLLFPLLLLSITTNTGASETVSQLISEADRKQLWKQKAWLDLGHYQGKGDDPAGYISDADDERFFLSDNGKTNPARELASTLEAFYATDSLSNEHALCRFPARLQWLGERLSLVQASLPEVDCSEFRQWRRLIKANSVTMVFPAYHLNSPSSMYGHTLLRIDPSEKKEWSDWLSYAVNFGADVTPGDNSIFYAFKGLSGGYPGIFITEPYFKKIQEYNKIEHRDIWEYHLNLSRTETERMYLHLWELKTINFDYYFFDENCSYRLLELLEVARPELELTDEFKLTAIPVDTVRAIEKAGLVESIDYRPAQSTVLQHRIERIPEQYHDLIAALADDSATLHDEKLTVLEPALQRRIVDAAYQHLRYEQTGKTRDPAIAARSFELLKAINRYPIRKESRPPPIPVSPEKGHGSKRVIVGASSRDETGYMNLGLRMSFHDLEDNEHGFLRGAQINIGSINFRTREDVFQLDQLDLVDIFSITPRTRFVKPLSWSVYTGLERQFVHGADELVAHVTAGAGVTYKLLRDSSWYLMARGRLEHNDRFDRNLEPAIGGTLGILQHFGWSTAHLQLTGDRFANTAYRLRSQYSQSFKINTNHAINLTLAYEWQEADEYAEFGIRYQYYFW